MYTKTGELNFALLMRATLALALSFLMAEPIVIEIFSDEIIADEARRMNAIEAHENNLLQMQIAPINLEISKNDSIMNSFLFELNREATGEGGSKKPGTGPIFTKRQHLYDEKKKEVDMNKQQKLEHIQILSKQTEERIRGECKNVATGLSGKYNTLDRLATQSSAIYWGTLLFRIVLVLFDMLPLLIKLIKPKRREELYSYLAQQQNDNYFDALNSQRKSGFQTVSNQVSSLSQHQLSESQRVLRQNTVDNLKIFIQQMANDSYDIHRTKKEAEAMIARLDDIDLKKTLIRRLNALIKAYYEDLQQKDKNNVFKTTFN
jgi:hypothetical protein